MYQPWFNMNLLFICSNQVNIFVDKNGLELDFKIKLYLFVESDNIKIVTT